MENHNCRRNTGDLCRTVYIMAAWLYRENGTRQLNTDGASVIAGAEATQAEWDDLSNCFPSEATATNFEWWRCISTFMDDGDELIFYDEADGVTQVIHTVEKGSTLNAVKTGEKTIRSRSDDPTQCLIRPQTDALLLAHNNNAAAANYTYQGLSIAGYAGGYSGTTAPALFQMSGTNAGDLTLNNCILGNVILASATNNPLGLIYAVNSTRTITLNDCVVENITTAAGYVGGVWIGQMAAGNSLDITGTLAIRNNTITVSTEVESGFKIYSDFSITAAVTIDDIVLHTDHATASVGPVFWCSNTSVTSITGSITANNIISTGGTAGCCIYKTFGLFNVNNVTATNITIVQEAGQNSVGAVCLASDTTAIGTFRKIKAEDIVCYSGSCVYFSDGATGIAESIIARRCTQNETGALYSGGFGDTTFRGFLVEDCTSQKAGGAVFGHNHDTGGGSAVDKTINIENGTIINCQGNLDGLNGIGDGNGIWTNTPDGGGQTLTTNIKNVVCRNGGSEEFLFTENTTEIHNVNIDACDVEGGKPAINHADIITGTYTEEALAPITDDATQINANGTLAKDAAYKTAGLFVRYGSRDANGIMFSLPVPIGGFSRASCSPDTRKPRV